MRQRPPRTQRRRASLSVLYGRSTTAYVRGRNGRNGPSSPTFRALRPGPAQALPAPASQAGEWPGRALANDLPALPPSAGRAAGEGRKVPTSGRLDSSNADLHPRVAPPAPRRRRVRAHPRARRRDGHPDPGSSPRRGGLPRPALRGPPDRPARQHRPAVADPARDHRRHPPPLSRCRRRHHRDQHLHRERPEPGRLRPGAPCPRDERGRRPARPRRGGRGRGPRRPAALGGRRPRPDQPDGVALARRRRRRAPGTFGSTSCGQPTRRAPVACSTAAPTSSSSRRSSTRSTPRPRSSPSRRSSTSVAVASR